LERYIGHLARYARLIPCLRPFVRRALALQAVLEARGTRGTSHVGELADHAGMLLLILQHWDGTSAAEVLGAPLGWPGRASVVFAADSSPLWGYGILCLSTGEWCAEQFSAQQLAAAWRVEAVSSTFLEVIPLVALLATFEHLVSGRRVHLRCDNTSAVAALRERWSPSGEPLNGLLRLFSAQQAFVDCAVAQEHLPRERNMLCDALSRSDIARFHSLANAQGARVAPSPSPSRVASLGRWGSLAALFSA
jgi:hypothetical protein